MHIEFNEITYGTDWHHFYRYLSPVMQINIVQAMNFVIDEILIVIFPQERCRVDLQVL